MSLDTFNEPEHIQPIKTLGEKVPRFSKGEAVLPQNYNTESLLSIGLHWLERRFEILDCKTISYPTTRLTVHYHQASPFLTVPLSPSPCVCVWFYFSVSRYLMIFHHHVSLFAYK